VLLGATAEQSVQNFLMWCDIAAKSLNLGHTFVYNAGGNRVNCVFHHERAEENNPYFTEQFNTTFINGVWMQEQLDIPVEMCWRWVEAMELGGSYCLYPQCHLALSMED